MEDYKYLPFLFVFIYVCSLILYLLLLLLLCYTHFITTFMKACYRAILVIKTSHVLMCDLEIVLQVIESSVAQCLIELELVPELVIMIQS